MPRPARPPTSTTSTRSQGARRPSHPTQPGVPPPNGAPSIARRRAGRTIVVAVAVALGLTAASCGSDPETTDPTSTTAGTSVVKTEPPATSGSTSTTTTPSGDEAEVRAVIDRYWDAWFIAAGNPPDPTNAELNAILTGDAAQKILGGIERRLNEGTYVRLPPNSVFERTITSVTFDEDGIATVLECVVDDSEIVTISAGEVVDNSVLTLSLTTTLREYPTGWRITTSTLTDETEGAAGCAS